MKNLMLILFSTMLLSGCQSLKVTYECSGTDEGMAPPALNIYMIDMSGEDAPDINAITGLVEEVNKLKSVLPDGVNP